ncbi:zinc finger and SCAN domain-containing protein 2-like [Branchiostoma floridae]|uniref:Zinc finger and SCAN domain-containing protein 2-like n=1 Tax=Branchiostoma floridae TaxID=7739 RepID=A0A9J7M8Y2_BRAFL|nr:zinc finger and SCAN domain-containing protein 2-like [Branchiostoma floridae]XP_035696952.1 zinc finger and SCAN domain-containing protein 2-like [Branchiostoma floridae]
MEEYNKPHWTNIEYASLTSHDSHCADQASPEYIGPNSNQFCNIMAHMMAATTGTPGPGEPTTRMIAESADHGVVGSRETARNTTTEQLGSPDHLTCTVTQLDKQPNPDENTTQGKPTDQVSSEDEEVHQTESQNSEGHDPCTSSFEIAQPPSQSEQGKTDADSDTDLAKYSVLYGGNQIFICDLCSLMFITESDLAQHIKTHPDKSPVIKQPHRRRPYKSWYANRVEENNKSGSGEKQFICKECGFSTNHRGKLIAHAKTHVVKKTYKCDQCTFSSVKKKTMDRHMLKHVQEGPFKCRDCAFTTSDIKDMEKHIGTHKERYNCELCPFSAVMKKTLERHLKMKHAQEDSTDSEASEAMVCDDSSDEAETDNSAEHTLVSESCEGVNDDTPEKETLENANAIVENSEENPSASTNSYPDTSHSASGDELGDDHVQEECRDLTFTTPDKEDREKHIAFTTPDKEDREKHIATHTELPGKPYKCSLCRYSAVKEKTLERHLKMKHSQEDSTVTEAPEPTDVDNSSDGAEAEDSPEQSLMSESCEGVNASTPEKEKLEDTVVETPKDCASTSKDSFPDMSDSASADELGDDVTDSDEDYIPKQAEVDATEQGHLDEDEDGVQNVPDETLACKEHDFVTDSNEKPKAHGKKSETSGGKPHKCKDCSYSTAYKSDLRQHMYKHNGKYPFECKVCGYKAARQKEMVQHSRIHTGEKPFKCDQCDFSTAQSSTLKVHKMRHSGEKQNTGHMFKCKECDYSTAHRADLRQHMFRHNGKYPFVCKVCGYKVGKRNAMVIHSRIHTGEKPFKCDQCDFSTTQRNSLKEHKMRHSGEKPHMCDVCGLRFYTKPNLNAHMNRHLDIKPELKKPHKCDKCEYATAHKTHLAIHVARYHTGEKPHMCEYCGYRTVDRSNLATHKKTHTGERPFKCDLCDYSSVAKKKLQQHMSKHTGEKPYMCTMCDFRTVYKPSLLSHMQRHTGEKPFKCDLCDYRAAQKSSLKSHMVQHTGEKSHICPDCGHKTAHRSNLLSHMRKIHKKDIEEKPLKCDQCDYRTAKTSSLKSHMVKHTGEKPHVCPDCGHRTAHRCNLLSHMRKVHKKHKTEVSPEFPNMAALLFPTGSGVEKL